MQVSRLVNYLERNINPDDRKTLLRLNKHINAKYARELNQLVATYNIDRKKVLFLPDDLLDEKYIYSITQLLLCCRKIINNKINIATFNPKQFAIGSMLDLSSSTRVDLLLRHLRNYNTPYARINIPKEIIDDPISVLYISIKKRIELGFVKKSEKKNINKINPKLAPKQSKMSAIQTITNKKARNEMLPKGYALKEDTGYALKEYNDSKGLVLQEVQDFNNNFIVDGDNLQSIVLENPLDGIVESGLPDEYISGDVAHRVAMERAFRARLMLKRGKLGKFYNLIDSILPVIIIILSVIAFGIGIATGKYIFMYVLIAFTVICLILFLYRLGMLLSPDDNFASKYYEDDIEKFRRFGILVGIAIIIQLVYLLGVSETHNYIMTKFGNYLMANRNSIRIPVFIFVGVDFLILVLVGLLCRTHKYIIFITQTIILYIMMVLVGLSSLLPASSVYKSLYVLKNYLIFIVALILGMIIYTITNNYKLKKASFITLGVVLLTYLILLLL